MREMKTEDALAATLRLSQPHADAVDGKTRTDVAFCEPAWVLPAAADVGPEGTFGVLGATAFPTIVTL